MKVYLNAGHDRQLDPGAVNRRLNLRECDAAYELALGVQQYLERNGIAVVFGQDDDLYHICDQANQAECDLFVSIHFNAYNGRASGTETLISGSTGSLMLGHCIQTNLKAVLNLPNRGLKERPGLFVLRNTVMPAVLVEVCFIDNDFDWRRYDAHRDEAARAIATGIMQYPYQMQGASGSVEGMAGRCGPADRKKYTARGLVRRGFRVGSPLERFDHSLSRYNGRLLRAIRHKFRICTGFTRDALSRTSPTVSHAGDE